ncbi:MAG: NRDE family protein [Desulfobacterales bacterium]|nr:NRDE family protein [Desulfobacterales bacterium]
MCLIVFAYNTHPHYRLILISNRDEFYQRPTEPLHIWQDKKIVAGRDLQSMGTWLGINSNRYVAALTNFRDPKSLKPNTPSRGELVCSWLMAQNTNTWMNELPKQSSHYNGFNLLFCDLTHCYYFSNQTNFIQCLNPGIYGLSNHLLDTPWPKLKKAKASFTQFLDSNPSLDIEHLFTLLLNTDTAKECDLPDTGVGIEWERILSSMFIISNIYGTRSSSIVLIPHQGNIQFIERTYYIEQKQIVAKQTVHIAI